MGIALFEDTHWLNFFPISLTRATFDIKVGARSFFEEHQAMPEVLSTREHLAGVTRERHGQSKVNPSSSDNDTVFVNGVLHPSAIYPERREKVCPTASIIARQRPRVSTRDRKGEE